MRAACTTCGTLFLTATALDPGPYFCPTCSPKHDQAQTPNPKPARKRSTRKKGK